jgi:hypothetical protein
MFKALKVAVGWKKASSAKTSSSIEGSVSRNDKDRLESKTEIDPTLLEFLNNKDKNLAASDNMLLLSHISDVDGSTDARKVAGIVGGDDRRDLVEDEDLSVLESVTISNNTATGYLYKKSLSRYRSIADSWDYRVFSIDLEKGVLKYFEDMSDVTRDICSGGPKSLSGSVLTDLPALEDRLYGFSLTVKNILTGEVEVLLCDAMSAKHQERWIELIRRGRNLTRTFSPDLSQLNPNLLPGPVTTSPELSPRTCHNLTRTFSPDLSQPNPNSTPGPVTT